MSTLRLADDVAVLTRGDDVEVRRDGQDALHLPGAGLDLDRLLSGLAVPHDEDELRASLPAGALRLMDLLLERRVLVPNPLCAHLADLHRATVDAREDLIPPAGVDLAGSDPAFLLRELGDIKIIRLPPPSTAVPVPQRARSQRSFRPDPVPIGVLGDLLGAGVAGLTSDESRLVDGCLVRSRAYPSGGGLYPVEVSLLPLRVEGIASAAFRYSPSRHALTQVGPPIDRQQLECWFPDQPVGDMAAVILLTMDFSRPTLSRYGGKAYRLALLEAGHLAHSVMTTATVLGLDSLPIAGFDDEALARAAGLTYPYQVVLYAVGLGPPADPGSALP